MGEMFYRRQPMSEIMAADYDDLKYFYGWSKAISKAEVKAIEDAKRKGGKR
jgi:hypothetical protein